jgi:hypothetical protein
MTEMGLQIIPADRHGFAAVFVGIVADHGRLIAAIITANRVPRSAMCRRQSCRCRRHRYFQWLNRR